ncbi:hypothetical protein CXP54_05680 [Escherichia albertii]|uniref:Uncharacterized protein n=1 Tax=Escherichia albertii TaxID=208962 RepID=A0ABX5HCW9_ESCAL|nr:hypothetical protein CXP54_05680 [Escherichia albertii]EAB1454324.1 hypothetical protein [Escherichia albertii]EEW7341746.1 hypothetical protein [Escherichia albertii]EEW7497291.1 hypothetical protein [Escherichia albertii]EEW7551831.1 hypothetical protein [Escherichia albertii]
MPANLFIYRLTNAPILVSGSGYAMQNSHEARAACGQAGSLVVKILKALPDRDKTKNPRLVNHI